MAPRSFKGYGDGLMLAYDIARCQGHGVGPQGYQIRADCVNCLRRTAYAKFEGVIWMEPPVDFPCPEKIQPRREEECASS